MKTYIQITGGRGPVECARTVALVAKELQEEYSDLELVDYEAHNTEPGCFMSMTFSTSSENVCTNESGMGRNCPMGFHKKSLSS